MKTFLAAFALIAALPAAAHAQSAPAQDHSQHQGMKHGAEHQGMNHGAEHQGMNHGGEKKGCCDHKTADGKPMDCCKGKDGKMSCCEKHQKQAKDGHAGHDMKH